MGFFVRIGERMDRQAQLMGAMMKRLDVDIASTARDGTGDRLEHAARTCLMCRDSDACQHWLESGSSEMPDFCPNLQYFADHRQR